MQRYLVEKQDWGTLATSYPHSPEDLEQSLQDYLEDKLSAGFEVVTFSWYGSTGWMDFIFKVVAK